MRSIRIRELDLIGADGGETACFCEYDDMIDRTADEGLIRPNVIDDARVEFEGFSLDDIFTLSFGSKICSEKE